MSYYPLFELFQDILMAVISNLKQKKSLEFINNIKKIKLKLIDYFIINKT